MVEEGSGKDFSLALQVSIERCRRTKKARVSSFELIPKLPYYNIIGQTLHLVQLSQRVIFFSKRV